MPAAANAAAQAVRIDLTGSMYVTGRMTDPSNTNHLIVRSNAGGTWRTVDDLAAPGGTLNGLDSFTVDTAGNLYVAGDVDVTAGANASWIVRSQPAAPCNLTATADATLSSSQVDLSWTNAAGTGETGFAIYRSTDGINFTPVATLGRGRDGLQ